MTREFNDIVKDHLKPDGMYLVNLIDGVHYDFLRAYVKTLTKTFPQVRMMVTPGGAPGAQNTFVLVASRVPPPKVRRMVSQARLATFLRERDAVTLTDDHVPVDQLLAPVFRKRMHEHIDQSQAAQ